jgi:hypothetical protein
MIHPRQSLTSPGLRSAGAGRFRRQRLGNSAGGGPVPDPPTDLAVDVSGGEFDLQWVDSFTNELGFIIEWSLDELTWEVWGTVAPNTTSVSIPPTAVTGPPANVLVYWRVKAFNSEGESGPSNVESGTVVDLERVNVNKLVPTALLDETNIQAVDVNKLVPTALLDETNIQAADVNKFVVTVILDETYP